MKNLIKLMLMLAFVMTSVSTQAQTYHTKNSKTTFYSHTLLEDISASSDQTKGILDAAAKTFFFKVPIQSFVFKSDLMREHFNENYIESAKFPYAKFKGKVEGTMDLTKDGIYSVLAVGDMTINSVTKNVSIPTVITVKGGVPSLESKFNVLIADYKIVIPTIVNNKIAEEIDVKVSAILETVK